MKRFWVTLLLLSMPQTASAGTWIVSPRLAPAVKAARTRLLLKVKTSGCLLTTPACSMLESGLRQATVQRRLAGYQLLAYDAEQGEGQDVAQRYNVVVFPTLLVIDNKGREVHRLTGHQPPKALASWLDRHTSGKGDLAALTARVKDHPQDLKLRLQLGTAWAMRGHKASALKHLRRVIDHAGTPQLPSQARSLEHRMAARAMLIRGQLLELRSLKNHQAAAETLRSLRVRYPTSPEASAAIYPMARAMHGLKRTKSALRLLRWWARSAAQHSAVARFCLRHKVALPRGLVHARKAVKLAPGGATLWATQGLLLRALGDHRGAGRSFARAVKLDPRQKWYRQQLLRSKKMLQKPTTK